MLNFQGRLKSLETSKDEYKEDLQRIEAKVDKIIDHLIGRQD